jgi:hypothetical protein
MKPTNEQIKDLEKALKLIYDSYILQNQAHIIIYENFEIDDDCNFLENDFYNLTRFNPSSPLYKMEVAIENLLIKLKNK